MGSINANRAEARTARKIAKKARAEARQKAKRGVMPDLISASTSGDSDSDQGGGDRFRKSPYNPSTQANWRI